MNTVSHKVAALAFIDSRLDELKEEFGDLPEKVKNQENKLKELKSMADETTAILEEIKSFISGAKTSLVELKTKEEKLVKQQFLVRNNKEFDAISHEIEHLKSEHEQLSARMRTEAIKEENLKKILEQQLADSERSKVELDEMESELKLVSGSQDNEVKALLEKREKILITMDDVINLKYRRVRSFHSDAAVHVRKNSCSGCFSAVPPQIVVEIRNNYDKTYTCENCGRILLPEDITVDEDLILGL